jgi:gluconolactonase
VIYEVLDDRFRPCVNGDQQLETLYVGCRWAEGPVYVPAWRQLVWSDIPNDRLLRWDEPTGSVGVFRSPAGYVNGNTLDRSGRLVSCEQGNRRVTRTEYDGSLTVIADRFAGHRLNSPNDATVKSDGCTRGTGRWLPGRPSRSARRATSTTCGWTTRAGSGSAPARTGCTAMRRTAP